LTFSDEFNASGKSSPDPTKWKYDLGDGSKLGIPGWGNGEQQYYTPDQDNAFVQDGSLHIVAKVNDTATNTTDRVDAAGAVVPFTTGITSARLTTSGWDLPAYGYVEVRAKLPDAKGAWPAIWMLGQQGQWPAKGEIDIAEWSAKYFDSTTVQAALHYSKDFGDTQTKTQYTLDNSVTNFHKYQLWWNETEIRIGVDGDYNSAYFTYTKDKSWGADRWPFVDPQYLLLNVAVGGVLGGNGYAEALAAAPYEMVVDYVRVYQAQQSVPAPATAPAAPTALAADVASLYSDVYTSTAGFDLPNWGQSKMLADTTVASNKVLKGDAFTYQGFQFDAIDATSNGLGKLHLDLWSQDGTPVKVYVISAGQDSDYVEVTPKAGAWKAVDIELSAFNKIDQSKIIQVKLDTGIQPTTKVMYFDNIYFGKATGAFDVSPSNVKVTFESNDISGYSLGGSADFGGNVSSLVTIGAPAGAAGAVAKVVNGGEGWSGTTFMTLSGSELINPDSAHVGMRVFMPDDASRVVKLKLENSAGVNKEVDITTNASGWQTLDFDFKGADHSVDYTKASVFFDFLGTSHPGGVYYFDNVTYNASVLPV
jgi:beta-glucanase (GH16 family)